MKKALFILLLNFWLIPVGHTQDTSKNYVKSYTARQPIKGTLSANTNKDQVQQTIAYVDGLGRPIQSIQRWGSPSGKDMVTHFTYDTYGRQLKQYLPFERNSTNATFSGNAIDLQRNFYNQHFQDNSGDFAFAEMQLEASPLDRPKKQGAPGQAWHIEGNHTADIAYRNNNTADQVRKITVNANKLIATTYYAHNQLMVIARKDENRDNATHETFRGETLEFTDKLGRVILKKVKAGTTAHYSTYYVYDDYGNLRYVLPPAAIEEISNANDDWGKIDTEAFQKKWMFCYEYDGRNRLIAKRVPGADWMYMIYDQRDRLVLTQDGNQRLCDGLINDTQEVYAYEGRSYQLGSTGKLTLKSGFRFSPTASTDFRVTLGSSDCEKQWIFTKYDALDRPVLTGFYHSTLDRTALQAEVDDFPDFVEAYTGNGSLSGYDNTAFPTAVDETDLLTVAYYDTYSFTDEVAPGGTFPSVKGQLTGAKTRVLGTENLLGTVNFYDDRYRPIRIITENHLGGKDIVKNTYRNSVSPLVEHATTYHNTIHRSGVLEVQESYAYDHMDRLLVTYQVILDNGVHKNGTVLSANTYNALGELSVKKLKNGIQHVDYQYNIRGWLTKINGGTTFDTPNDKFGMQLKYDEAHQYNGNIGMMSWKSLGGNNTSPQTYAYTYDPLSRLKKASYTSVGSNGQYNVGGTNGIQYDANGNILALSRNQGVNGQVRLIDELSYTYEGGGNQLLKVTDAGDAGAYTSSNPKINKIKDLGFLDGNASGNDYSYDSNGNMIRDNNKDIINISYNHLNLPERVRFENGNYVDFTYDAAGIKIKKESLTGASLTTIDYVSGKQYRNNNLEFFQHAEGRVVKNGTAYHHEFNLTDHLGNIRVSINEQGGVIQKDDYYPFGLTFNSYVNGLKNQYTYNSKEFNEENGLNWHDYQARNYDAAIGRWFNVDPAADLMRRHSPYNYAFDNPIRFIDPDGMKPTEGEQKCPNGDCEVEVASDATNRQFLNIVDPNLPFSDKLSAETKIENGTLNITFGLVGAVASGAYAVGTGGVGAALGGGLAFGLSLGEVSIGIAQLTDGLNEYFGGETNKKNSEILQNASSLPGLIAYGQESEYAPFIDATGQFIVGPLSGGIGIYDGFKSLVKNPGVLNTLNLYDSVNDYAGFDQESTELLKSLLLNDEKHNKESKE